MKQDSADSEPLGSPTSQDLVVELVGSGHDVLLVGCADGAVARGLAAAGCRVTGLDIDESVASEAVESLDRLVVLDLDGGGIHDALSPATFDVLVLAGTLGRLVDPAGVLRDAARLLREHGRVVASVPNVAHGSVRLALLQGRWGADEQLHGFTDRSLLDLLESVGLAADALRSTVADPLEGPVAVDDAIVLPRVIEWVRHQPTALDRDYVVAARRAGEAGPRPAVEPAASYASVRRHDRYSEQMEQDQKARYDLLTMRDHIIGLEASVAAAQAREADARSRLRAANKRLREQAEEKVVAGDAASDSERGGVRSALRRRGTRNV
ncbi:class I SAM-dependent methyltransferase [Nocardioides sp. CGMCC 1.13656]|uniref:class I SAM-dependent methyltransferase n=1 Tax=Nocardioides TaxID=1839 RepID=UPI0012F9A676|nr:class I SAM-dependent methyltransferase [Nocardioides sp. CGMCC 1.13656]MBA2955578.1 class I SAM-dependent methyltransferase [Nocardioides sp. CGMCC 1.13656]